MSPELELAMLKLAGPVVVDNGGGTPQQVTENLLRSHPNASMQGTTLTLPPVQPAAVAAAATPDAAGRAIAQQTGVSKVTISKTGPKKFSAEGQINPVTKTAEFESVRLDMALENFNDAKGTTWFTVGELDGMPPKNGVNMAQAAAYIQEWRPILKGPVNNRYMFMDQKGDKLQPNDWAIVERAGEKRWQALAGADASWTKDVQASELKHKVTGAEFFKTFAISDQSTAAKAKAKEIVTPELTRLAGIPTIMPPMEQPQGDRALMDDEVNKKFLKWAGDLVAGQVKTFADDKAGDDDKASIATDVGYQENSVVGRIIMPGLKDVNPKLANTVGPGRGKNAPVFQYMRAAAARRTFGDPPNKIEIADHAAILAAQPNKTYLGNKVRDAFEGDPSGGGPHEWIPSNFVDEVVKKATAKIMELGGPLVDAAVEEGFKWIELHHDLRSLTFDVVFKPEKTFDLKPEKTQAIDPLDGVTKAVLQGHSGAVSFPRGGAIVEQTTGQEAFHDALRAAFVWNGPDTIPAYLARVVVVIGQWVYKGTSSKPVHPDCRPSNAARTAAPARIDALFTKYGVAIPWT
jgi:hypothetical protein